MDEHDVALTEGAAYYADTAEHENYKAKAAGRSELSGEVSRCILDVTLLANICFTSKTYICSKFEALKDTYAGKKRSGQLSLNCTRHEMVLPTGTVDMDKGEKYVLRF